MTSADVVWGGVLAAGAVVEAYALWSGRQGDTLSETTRRTFRVHTPTGRATFAVVWVGFAVWYFVHILW